MWGVAQSKERRDADGLQPLLSAGGLALGGARNGSMPPTYRMGGTGQAGGACRTFARLGAAARTARRSLPGSLGCSPAPRTRDACCASGPS